MSAGIFTTEDVGNISAAAAAALLSGKIDEPTARRIIKTAARCLNAMRASLRAADEKQNAKTWAAIDELREAQKMLSALS